MIFLPIHRSHLDYVLMAYVLWNFELRVPHVASGDNLNLSGFGWLLRGLGAFFIRRRLEKDNVKDHVYRAVLHSYMEEILRRGETIEFFMEGGRSRTGKTLLPKSGLLSVVVDSCLEGTVLHCTNHDGILSAEALHIQINK